MTLPKHAHIKQDFTMEAPYNFVPLPEKVFTVERNERPKFDRYAPDRHTGYFDLTITTETPLYTRCAYPPELAGDPHRTPEKQQFFHHGGREKQPVLPGSSLRGMLRTLVETISHGKIGNVRDDRFVARFVGESTSAGTLYRNRMCGSGSPIPYPSRNIKGGYLEVNNKQWYIREAVEFSGETFAHTERYPSFAPGHAPKVKYNASDVVKVWIKPPSGRINYPGKGRPPLNLALIASANIRQRTTNTPLGGSGWKPATLVRSGHMAGGRPKHMHCVIYQKNMNNQRIKISPDLRELYQKDLKNNQNSHLKRRELRNSGDPLFYLVENGCLVFFGPTMMFRLPYKNNVHTFIPQELRESDKLDMAEAIFGTTSFRGRVSFTDACFSHHPDNGAPFYSAESTDIEGGRLVLKILSSPKATAFQNYLVQPVMHTAHPNWKQGQLLLHYDHSHPGKHQLRERIRVNGQPRNDTATTDGTVIRGIKFYWNKNVNIHSVREAADKVQTDAGGLSQYLGADNTWRDATGNDASPQHTVIRPVRSGCIFTGRMYFENLSAPELGAIIAALELNGESSRHRLGMGKPYGMGRIRIKAALHFEDRKKRYASLAIQDQETEINDEKKQNCLDSFTEAIVNHHSFHCGGGQVNSLWEIPRLADLAKLLNQNGPGGNHTDYIALNHPQGKWKKRHILPTPIQVVDQDIAPPEVIPVFNPVPQGASIPTIPRPPEQIRDEMIEQFKNALPPANQLMSQAQRLVDKIRTMNEEIRKECCHALLVLARTDKKKFEKAKKQDKRWLKRILDLCDELNVTLE